MINLKFISSKKLSLPENSNILNSMLKLIESVYDYGASEAFQTEIMNFDWITIAYLEEEDNIIGLGCIVESYIAFGVYELSWGMVHEKHRGNGYGKLLVDARIDYVKKHKIGNHTPKDVIVMTASPWHLSRCGFEIIKEMNSDDNLVLMYKKITH